MSTQTLVCPLQLEGKTAGGSLWAVSILTTPFVVGRHDGCHLRLAVNGISRIHAEILERDGVLWISDCASTNGTFVNHRRLTAAQPLKPGDSVQFGDVPFTVAEYVQPAERTEILNPHARQFESMMAKKAVTPYFQPIVRFADLTPMGYEILGRVHYADLPQAPGPLFQIAKKLNRQAELSLLFREQAFAQAGRLGVPGLLFFNLLPEEMDTDAIGLALSRVRREFPALRLAMELHESVVTDVPMIKRLRQVLQALGVFLVYDDFGAGQARLLELMEAPPDVIKFDISLIHQIDKRPAPAQAIVAALVKMAREAGIGTLAEGVESRDEGEVCQQFGFDLAQGFYYGRPAPLAASAGRLA